MDDEYLERYKKVEHSQLYRELTAGSPPGVDALADAWHTTAQTIQATAADLRADLATLQASWSGQTSDEFQYRIGLVATFAETVAAEALNMYTGLSAMSGALTSAQANGRPAPVAAVDWTHDAVLAQVLGHSVTQADATQAQDDLATVVAQLAISYGLADNTQWQAPRPDPSPDLPGHALAVDIGVDPPPAATGSQATAAGVVASVTGPATATQLAGTVGVAPPAPDRSALSLAPLMSTAPGQPAAPPVAPGMAVTMLSGAGSGTASSQTGFGTDPSAAGMVTGSSTSLPPPVMGMGGTAPGSAAGPGVISRPLHDEETAWATSEDDGWAHPGDSPPPVLGHPNR
jgi:hypothetical protein